VKPVNLLLHAGQLLLQVGVLGVPAKKQKQNLSPVFYNSHLEQIFRTIFPRKIKFRRIFMGNV
jgi:hypothetical protein